MLCYVMYNYNTCVDTSCHYVPRRFKEFSSGILVIETPIETVSNAEALLARIL